MAESDAPEYQPPMRLAQRKFLLIGIVLAMAIGAGLAALNHYVREENKFHEAEQEMVYRVKPARAAQSRNATMPASVPAPIVAGLSAPTRSAPPPR